MGVLRLLLALTVLNWHYQFTHYNFIFSYSAVFLFMIISGFYISMVLDQRYGPGVKGALLFYGNRLLRLLPPYWVVFLATSAFNPPGGDWLNNLLLFPHALWAQLALTPGDSNELYFGQMLTVALEMMFYAIAPLIVLRVWYIQALAFAAAAALNGVLWWNGADAEAWQYQFFPSILIYFFAGSLAYRLYLLAMKWPVAPFIGHLALPMIVFTGWLSRSATGPIWTNDARIYAYYALCTMLIPFLFIASSRWRFDRFIGDLSYPLYIVHAPVIWLIWKFASTEHSDRGAYVVLLLSLVFAVLLAIFIDRPIDKWRHRLTAKELRLRIGRLWLHRGAPG